MQEKEKVKYQIIKSADEILSEPELIEKLSEENEKDWNSEKNLSANSHREILKENKEQTNSDEWIIIDAKNDCKEIITEELHTEK